MNNENKSIHDFDFNLICEYFSNLERQGPGSPESTLRALGFIDRLGPDSRIADLGCGTGGQTRVLARHTPGMITGIDLFPGFIDIFNRQARAMGLQNRLKGRVGSICDPLPFGETSLDLIWSEGAIYNIGFERGLNEWRRYLKPGGFLAVTEASWFTDKRPAEIEEFWQAYPEIDTIPVKTAQLQKAGYALVALFVLPETNWTAHFFAPQIPVQEEFLKQHAGNRAAGEFIQNMRYESRLYEKYKSYYGYVFYIGQKI